MFKVNNTDTRAMSMTYEWESVNPQSVWNNHPASNYMIKVNRGSSMQEEMYWKFEKTP